MTGNSQRTLVILTPAFPQDESDSVWVPSKQLFVKKLQENFPDLHIIVLAFNYPFHTETYTWHGVEVISFNGFQARKLQRLRLWIRVWRALKKIRQQHAVIGIYSFWCGECALVGRHFARRHGIRFFCWISGMDAKKNNKLVKLIRPQSHELVAMSHFLVKEFEKNHFIRPQYIIPIGIDPSEFTESLGKRDIDILGVGSLSPFKRYDIFVWVIKAITKKFPGIKAVICGDGSERELVEQLIQELQLENNITLLGVQSHAEALQLMQRARVFLHPSTYEGFGAVFLEALYAGAQVVSFCYPLKEPVSHWHVVNDQAAMIAKVFEIVEGPQIPHTSVMVYAMDESAKAVMKLYDE